MAVTVTDLHTLRADGDATTSWGGSHSATLYTANPPPIEATGHLGFVVNNEQGYAIHSPGGSVDLSSTLVYVWFLPGPAMASRDNHGFGITLSDGTNIIQYNLGGSDLAAFRHNTGVPAYQCLMLDTANPPTSFFAHSGSEASLNFAAITGIGAGFTTTLKAVGGTENCFVDIVRFGTDGLRVSDGTTGDRGSFAEIAALDASVADGRAHGVIRELATGLFSLQGPLQFVANGAAHWFEDKNVTVVFEDRSLLTTRYSIEVNDDAVNAANFILGTKVGTGVDATGVDGVSLIAPTGVGASFTNAIVAGGSQVLIYGSIFDGFTGGIFLPPGQAEFIGNLVSGSGKVAAGNVDCVNTSIVASTVAADDSAMSWNANVDPNGLLDGVSISKGDNAHHAIEFGTSSPTTMTLSGVQFQGFNAANGQNDSTLHIRRTTGTVTINITGGGDVPSYKSDGATVVVQATSNIALTGIEAGSEVTIVRTSDDTVLFNVENSAGGTENYSHDGTAINVDILVFHVNYEPVAINTDIGASDASIPIQQIEDLVYSNP